MSEKGCQGALRVLVMIPFLIWLLVTWVCSCCESASSCVLMTRAISCMYITIKKLMATWRQTTTQCNIPSVLRRRQWPSLPISRPFPDTAPQVRTTLPAPFQMACLAVLRTLTALTACPLRKKIPLDHLCLNPTPATLGLCDLRQGI